MVEEVKSAAHINLSDRSADVDKVGERGRCGRRSLAVKVGNTKDIDITAVQVAGATRISCLTLNFGSWDGHGTSEEAEESDE